MSRETGDRASSPNKVLGYLGYISRRGLLHICAARRGAMEGTKPPRVLYLDQSQEIIRCLTKTRTFAADLHMNVYKIVI